MRTDNREDAFQLIPVGMRTENQKTQSVHKVARRDVAHKQVRKRAHTHGANSKKYSASQWICTRSCIRSNHKRSLTLQTSEDSKLQIVAWTEPALNIQTTAAVADFNGSRPDVSSLTSLAGIQSSAASSPAGFESSVASCVVVSLKRGTKCWCHSPSSNRNLKTTQSKAQGSIYRQHIEKCGAELPLL